VKRTRRRQLLGLPVEAVELDLIVGRAGAL